MRSTSPRCRGSAGRAERAAGAGTHLDTYQEKDLTCSCIMIQVWPKSSDFQSCNNKESSGTKQTQPFKRPNLRQQRQDGRASITEPRITLMTCPFVAAAQSTSNPYSCRITKTGKNCPLVSYQYNILLSVDPPALPLTQK